MPTAALVAGWAIRTSLGRPLDSPLQVESAKAIRTVIAVTTLYCVALHLLMLAGLSGLSVPRSFLPRIGFALFGLFIIGIGNVLPRVRPNMAIGISTPALLADRVAWAQVHRLAGRLMVILGTLSVGVGLILSTSHIPIVVSVAAVAAALLTFGAYRRWTHG